MTWRSPLVVIVIPLSLKIPCFGNNIIFPKLIKSNNFCFVVSGKFLSRAIICGGESYVTRFIGKQAGEKRSKVALEKGITIIFNLISTRIFNKSLFIRSLTKLSWKPCCQIKIQRRCDDDCNGCFAVCCLVKIRKLIRLTNPVPALTELDVQQKKRLCVSRDRDHSHHGKKCYYRRENEINKFRKIRQ